MVQPIKAVAFDVLETLFPLDPLRVRLEAIGLPAGSLDLWFSRVLRDGFALAAVDVFKPFSQVASAALSGLAEQQGIHLTSAQLQAVLAGFAELPAHPDVRPAFQLLKAAGIPIAIFSNGSDVVMRKLLVYNNLTDFVQQVISIDDPQAWKPRAESYQYAAGVLHCHPTELALVAAHSWDCHGAKQAGLTAGWVRRKEPVFNPTFGSPDVRGTSLEEVVDRLMELSKASAK